MTLSVVIAAGGTGGHLLPALAIAGEIVAARPGVHVRFAGTAREVEADLLAAAGYPASATCVRPFGRGSKAITGPLSLVPATWQARSILRRAAANVVIGMGGYPSLPVVAAARMAGIPALVHEQNAVPGLANEVAARMTPHIAVSFPAAAAAFRSRARVIGVPLRPEIARLDRTAARAEAMRAFDLDPARRTVLAFGGSLGAARINEAVRALGAAWRDRRDVQILLAAGRQQAGAAGDRDPGVVRRRPFIERMDLAYAAADVVVARSGASTVAELAATGTPAVLVPLPIARRREQHANAAVLVDAGAAVLVENADLTGARLGEILDDLLASPERLSEMGIAARGHARPNAAREMAAWAIELGEGK